MIALIALMVVFIAGTSGVWLLKQFYLAFEAVTFGMVSGSVIFLKGGYRLTIWAARTARGARRIARIKGLYAAQVAHARYFVWSHFVRGWYVRNELRQRHVLGKSGIPSTHDK